MSHLARVVEHAAVWSSVRVLLRGHPLAAVLVLLGVVVVVAAARFGRRGWWFL